MSHRNKEKLDKELLKVGTGVVFGMLVLIIILNTI